MAAIDKLYANEYYEFQDLVEWALIYYPTLLRYFYDWRMTYSEFEKRKKEWVKSTRKYIIRDYERLGKYKTKEQAIENIIEHYKKTYNYNCSYEQAKEEVDYCINQYRKSNLDLENEYSLAVCNLRTKQDNYLKWYCPLPFVREYLHKQCGVNPKLEWLYKLFWKGKKEFL